MVRTRSNKFLFLLRRNLPDFNLQNRIACTCPQKFDGKFSKIPTNRHHFAKKYCGFLSYYLFYGPTAYVNPRFPVAFIINNL